MNDDEILMGATQIAHKVQKKVQIKGEKNVKSNWQASNKFLVCIISVAVDYTYACFKQKIMQMQKVCKCTHFFLKMN